MSDTSDSRTLAFYEEEAPSYTAGGAGGVNRDLHDFLDLLPEGARILELGCGGGTDAEAMIARGFDLRATDGTPEIAAQAGERLGRRVDVLKFDALDAVDAYDAVWCSASLLHVPRRALPDVLRRVHRALRPGGWHYASYKSGVGEGRDRFGRYFNYLSREEAEAAYATSPWRMHRVIERMGGGYDNGRPGPWVALILQKPG